MSWQRKRQGRKQRSRKGQRKNRSPNASSLIKRAINFARKRHRGQKRYDGRPYVTHPLAAMKILQDNGVRCPFTLAAAVLKDIREEAAVPKAEVKALFGSRVARIVGQLTDLQHREPYGAWTARLVMATKRACREAQKIRLAARYHNLLDPIHRTLQREKDSAIRSLAIINVISENVLPALRQEALRLADERCQAIERQIAELNPIYVPQ